MSPENKLFIETNRHHLETINRHQYVKNLQLQKMLTVMREEFHPNYPSLDESSAVEVFQLVRDFYAAYDNSEEKSRT